MKKWHKIVLILIVVLGIAVCIKSCTDKVDSDIIIAYVGNSTVSGAQFEKNVAELENVCDDISGDGVANVTLMEVTFNDNLSQEAALRKMTNAVGLGTARVYIMTEAYIMINATYDVFEDLSQFGEGFRNADGNIVAISLEGNEKVKALGFPENERLYLAVRKVTEIDETTDETIHEKHNSAMKIAEYILN